MERVAALLSFRGRTDRRGYWTAFAPINAVIAAIIWLVATDVVTVPWQLGLPLIGIFIAALGANLALGVRRLHDVGRSGVWTMAYYVLPAVTTWASGRLGDRGLSAVLALVSLGLPAIGLFELGLRAGSRGPNRFGPDPAGRVDLAAFE